MDGDLSRSLHCFHLCKNEWFCTTGAAEDGRAPTEELSCLRSKGFCSMDDENDKWKKRSEQ